MIDRSKLEQSFRTARLIHLAFLGSVLIYALAPALFSVQARELFAGDSGSAAWLTLRLAFFGAAVMMIVFIRQLRGPLGRRLHPLTGAIMTGAFCEVPALLGLVYFFISGGKRDFYFLLAISVVLLVMNLPRIERWEEWDRRKPGEPS